MQSTNFNLYMGAERQLSSYRPLVLRYTKSFLDKSTAFGLS